MANKTKQPKRVLTEAQRLARNEKARARHWLKTGVSQQTVNWMKDHNFL